MTADEFRELALALPEAVEKRHMDHPDFRVKGKIFASLGPKESWGMVKLTPEEQSLFVRTDPKMFEPFAGAWGKRGCTKVILEEADSEPVWQALAAAWRNSAPKKLHALLDE
jgi:hypothetical protein